MNQIRCTTHNFHPLFLMTTFIAGAIMENLAQKLLGLKKSSFIPRHKNNLCNEFWCYSNFDLDKLL